MTASTPRPGRGPRPGCAQLAAWPQAVDAALAALDQVSAPVADALLSGIRGLAAGLPADAPAPVAAAALDAHQRLVAAHDAGGRRR